jgi:hypothetical protein
MRFKREVWLKCFRNIKVIVIAMIYYDRKKKIQMPGDFLVLSQYIEPVILALRRLRLIFIF